MTTKRSLLARIVGAVMVAAAVFLAVAYTLQGRVWEQNDLILVLALLVIGGSFWQSEWILRLIGQVWPWGKKGDT